MAAKQINTLLEQEHYVREYEERIRVKSASPDVVDIFLENIVFYVIKIQYYKPIIVDFLHVKEGQLELIKSTLPAIDENLRFPYFIKEKRLNIFKEINSSKIFKNKPLISKEKKFTTICHKFKISSYSFIIALLFPIIPDSKMKAISFTQDTKTIRAIANFIKVLSDVLLKEPNGNIFIRGINSIVEAPPLSYNLNVDCFPDEDEYKKEWEPIRNLLDEVLYRHWKEKEGSIDWADLFFINKRYTRGIKRKFPKTSITCLYTLGLFASRRQKDKIQLLANKGLAGLKDMYDNAHKDPNDKLNGKDLQIIKNDLQSDNSLEEKFLDYFESSIIDPQSRSIADSVFDNGLLDFAFEFGEDIRSQTFKKNPKLTFAQAVVFDQRSDKKAKNLIYIPIRIFGSPYMVLITFFQKIDDIEWIRNKMRDKIEDRLYQSLFDSYLTRIKDIIVSYSEKCELIEASTLTRITDELNRLKYFYPFPKLEFDKKDSPRLYLINESFPTDCSNTNKTELKDYALYVTENETWSSSKDVLVNKRLVTSGIDALHELGHRITSYKIKEDEAKSQFLPELHHEFGNSINILQNTIYRTDLNENELRVEMKKSTNNLNELYQDWIRPERLREAEEVSLKDILEEIKSQTVKTPFPIELYISVIRAKVKANRRKLYICLNELVRNAINYMDAKDDTNKLVIEIFSSEDGNFFVIKICDTGCGLKKEVFEEIKNTITHKRGGLSYSIRYLKEINGDIELKSEKGKGTILIVTLPISNGGGNNAYKL